MPSILTSGYRTAWGFTRSWIHSSRSCQWTSSLWGRDGTNNGDVCWKVFFFRLVRETWYPCVFLKKRFIKKDVFWDDQFWWVICFLKCILILIILRRLGGTRNFTKWWWLRRGWASQHTISNGTFIDVHIMLIARRENLRCMFKSPWF